MTTAATAGKPPAVALRGIDKRFGAVHATRDVHLTVAAGMVPCRRKVSKLTTD